MPRPPRVQYENAIYHVIAKGNRGQRIFLNGADTERFLGYLKEAQKKFSLEVYCFALLDNHFHISLRTRRANLSKAMQWLQTSYSMYFNVKYKKAGHLFAGRYKSLLVEDERYLIGLSYYVHLNPVKAGIVEQPWHYKWSSAKAYVGNAKELSWLSSDVILNLFSSDKNKRREMYKNGLMEGSKAAGAIEKTVKRGFLLGGHKFKEKIHKTLEKRKERNIRRKTSLEADDILDAVCRHYNRDRISILTAKRKKADTGKDVAVYLFTKHTYFSRAEIGQLFRIGPSAVAKSASRIRRRMAKDNTFKREIETIPHLGV